MATISRQRHCGNFGTNQFIVHYLICVGSEEEKIKRNCSHQVYYKPASERWIGVLLLSSNKLVYTHVLKLSIATKTDQNDAFDDLNWQQPHVLGPKNVHNHLKRFLFLIDVFAVILHFRIKLDHFRIKNHIDKTFRVSSYHPKQSFHYLK